MQTNRKNKKTVSFRRSLVNNDNSKSNLSPTKKSGILRDKNKNDEELKNEKTLEVVQEEEEKKEEENHEKIEEKKFEIPYEPSTDNNMNLYQLKNI